MSQDSEMGPEAVLNLLGQEFDEFCQARHNQGAKEYGPTAFLGNSMFKMIAEEMADIANYCRYEYIKLRLMEGSFDEGSVDFARAGASSTEHPVPSATSPFVGAGGLHDLLQGQEGLQDPGQRGSGGIQDDARGPDSSSPGA
jgi:hypothetical protein